MRDLRRTACTTTKPVGSPLLVSMGIATKKETEAAMWRVAQQAIDEAGRPPKKASPVRLSLAPFVPLFRGPQGT